VPLFIRYESLARVMEWLDGQAIDLPVETVPLAEAAGRVLAEDARALAEYPPFDHARADGYAVRGLDTAGASGYGPVPLVLRDEAVAGATDSRLLEAGTAVRVDAGARLPEGADAVIPLAFADEVAGVVELSEAVAPGENVALRGEDFREGEILLTAGRRLSARDLALLAAAGFGAVGVRRRPRVRILILGAGLAASGGERGPGEVFEASAAMLSALASRDGGLPEAPRRVPRASADLVEALRERGADLVLAAGGSGEGADDLAAAAVAEAGRLAFHGIALEPARSAGVGRVDETLVFILPGDPAACFCGYEALAAPVLRRWSGDGAETSGREARGVLVRKIVSSLGAVDFCPLRRVPGGFKPVPPGLAGLAAADGFLLVPEDSEGYPAGSEVAMVLFEP
jgi:molybdopterin molybdotransferase